ncbi:MAG: DUF1622 domain-containing protein [Pseudomonadota bacterium]
MALIGETAEIVADIVDAGVILLLAVGLCFLIAKCARSWINGEALTAIIVKLRLNLGQLILLALELLIISDILHSIAHRSLQDLGVLAAIVFIRILLVFFLDQELDRLSLKDT